MAAIVSPWRGHGSMARYGSGRGESAAAVANMRSQKMYEEAAEFRSVLTEWEVSVKQFREHTSEFLTSMEPLLDVPLPRVWDNVEGGLAEPIRATVSHFTSSHVLGTDAELKGLRAAVTQLEERLSVQVARPLAQWREALDTAKERMPEVNRLRRELNSAQSKIDHEVAREDARRRRRLGLEPQAGGTTLLYRCTHPRAESPPPRARSAPRLRGSAGSGTTSPTPSEREHGRVVGSPAGVVDGDEGGEDAGREFQSALRDQERTMAQSYKTRKRDAIAASFEEQEELLWRQLAGLCRDAAWLKSYMVAGLTAGKEALQLSTMYLGSTKQPLPGYPPAPGMGAGTTAQNIDLIKSRPHYLHDRASRQASLEALRARVSREGLQPARATASPMELHARTDLSASGVLPPVRRAAADRPLAPPTLEPAGPMAV